MIDSLYLYPITLFESLITIFVVSKYSKLNPNYGLCLTGALCIGLSLLDSIRTDIDTYIHLSILFIIYAIEQYIEFRNKFKSISIWTNSLKYSLFGILSGLCLLNNQYIITVLSSIYTTSYALGYRYIEFATDFKEKIPLIIYVLSTPFGIFIGSFIHQKICVTALASGLFFSYGISNIYHSFKCNNLNIFKKYALLLCILFGLIIASIMNLYFSSIGTDIAINKIDYLEKNTLNSFSPYNDQLNITSPNHTLNTPPPSPPPNPPPNSPPSPPPNPPPSPPPNSPPSPPPNQPPSPPPNPPPSPPPNSPPSPPPNPPPPSPPPNPPPNPPPSPPPNPPPPSPPPNPPPNPPPSPPPNPPPSPPPNPPPNP